jgi:anti-anti-sigma regulatory factor
MERGAAHWVLKGEIALGDVVELRDIMLRAVETPQDLLIDCTSVTYFDTAALQFLASLRVEARTLGVSFQIQGLPGSVLADAMPRSDSTVDQGQRQAG